MTGPISDTEYPGEVDIGGFSRLRLLPAITLRGKGSRRVPQFNATDRRLDKGPDFMAICRESINANYPYHGSAAQASMR